MPSHHEKWTELRKSRRGLTLLIIGGLAVLLFALSFLPTPKKTPSSPPTGEIPTTEKSADTVAVAQQAYEDALKSILEAAFGKGNVRVLVTIDSVDETDYAQNTKQTQQTVQEDDGQGGRRTTTEVTTEGDVVLTQQGIGTESGTALVEKRITPHVRGVVVAVAGGEHPAVQEEVVAAVQSAFGLLSDKVTVLPLTSSEEISKSNP
ncbi:MAG: hypothetical protein IMW91_02605 [Firmicutes bacterium]|nr:hypothetical protein [Bacillota bacterium]